MDFPIRWREVLSSVQQAAFSLVFLPMRDEGSEDAVASESEYRIRSRREIDTSLTQLHKGGTSSLHNGSTSGNVSETSQWEKILWWHRLLAINSLKFMGTTRPLISGLQAGFTLRRHGEGI